MSMTSQQRKYLVERINGITAAKEKAAREACTKPSKILSHAEIHALLLAGKVPMKPAEDKKRSSDWLSEFFDFSEFTWGSTVDTDKLDPMISEINRVATALKDDIMLGDAESALERLRAYAGEEAV